MHLNFAFELPFEARPYDLPLTRLQTIRDRWDRPNIISHGKENEFLVDKIGDRDFICIVVEEGARL